MLVSFWIGVVLSVVVFVIVFSRWAEKYLWTGLGVTLHDLNPWLLKSQVKDQEASFVELENELSRLKVTHNEMYVRIYDVDGLETQVADLKQVLEWTRTSLNDAKQEILEQMGWAHEDRERLKVSEAVHRDQTKSLRQRSTLIRELEEHIAERDNVITNLRSLLTLHKQASQRSALKFTRPTVSKKRNGI
jgi:chromosome segregation ATPase